MSEELLQTVPVPIGRYTYYRLGATTVAQLNRAGIIAGKPSSEIRKKKPDGMIVLGKGAAKAWIEYKTPAELRTKAQIRNAIGQAIEPASHLCNLLVVSDGQKTQWINPHTGGQIKSDIRLPVFNAKCILDKSATTEYLLSIESVIDQADHSLSRDNDTLSSPSLIDPSNLAQTIWQKIWINTGKEPEKCLYNVVEVFVFKFLSDLSVLQPHENFEFVCGVGEGAGHEDALRSYANISRPAIRALFPDGEDGTGIINGTIFVNEKGEPNNSQARLFCEVLEHLRTFDQENGSFKYIEKEFKTRLYESFLRQGAGLHHLGQFFTPRNVVQAIVGMASADNLPPGASICDPFCGVGGFLLEAILQSPRLAACFQPKNGTIEPGVSFVGYDRGSDEKEDERTIILAKANALIYFSDLIARYNTRGFAEEFARKVINAIFTLVRTNLGTFGMDDRGRHDLILTNPPYVTRGSSSLKKAIAESGLADWYSASGRGTESLALQWIERSLKPGGTAITIVPDGLLNQEGMRRFLKEKCIVNAIISLPTRTFYATPKKTYILAFSRKRRDERQTTPIFAYFVSETGETRDANRWTQKENDLLEATSLYNQFKGAPDTFLSPSERCKIIPWDEFDTLEHWMIDRLCWSSEELQQLGVEQTVAGAYTLEEFDELLEISVGEPLGSWENGKYDGSFAEVFLGDKSLFLLRLGKRVLKRDCVEKGIPCISANVNDVFGYIPESRLIHDFTVPSLTWGIDGNFDWFLIPPGVPFHPTDHCGILRIHNADISPDYLYHALRATRDRHGFDRTYRASLKNVARVSAEIPVGPDGSFDMVAQRQMAETYRRIEEKRQEACKRLRRVEEARVSFL